jgi:type 1 fimbria pilin
LQTFASATLFAALCFTQPFALAQDGGNGKGTLTVEGEVTDSTCVVYFKDPTGTQAASSSTLKLTAVKLADLKAVPNAGDEYSATPDKFTIVSLGTSAASTSCSLDGKLAWDFEINSTNTTTIGSKVLLSTVAADSGSSASRSNVLVQLKAKVIDDLSNPDTTGATNVEPSN